ncbi:hypothetical protein [Mediterraneibacter gnavus]|uniref:hypothetical protein n=1 Tax=Mediterraneibacter gnavus TaxID=33038 RepID=UPI0036D246C0
MTGATCRRNTGVTPQPPVQEKEQADLDASAAIPTTATEQPPVLPIILSSEKPADKMKEDYRPTGTGDFRTV